jgi:hypothetical protein
MRTESGLEKAGRPAEAVPYSRLRILAAGFLVVFPAVLFYTILLREAVNLPDMDDYEALLGFLNQMVAQRGVSAKVSYFFAAQYFEYKLFFEHAVFLIQYAVLGHVDFRLLCAIGNGFVLLIAVLLWKMFLPAHKNLAERLLFFIPVSWLIFQFQYVEALDWTMESWQSLPVVFFSLGAIYFLMMETRRAYFWAVIFLILAVGSSGNGFLMIPIGALILVLRRHYERVAGWAVVSAGCVAAYAYRYDIMSASDPHRSTFSSLIHVRPLFLINFLGTAAARPLKDGYFVLNTVCCPVLGVVLCVFVLVLMRRGYFRRNPLVGYCCLFLLLTAVGVAGMRGNFDISQSFASRYGMYSSLLLIFVWFGIVEEFLLRMGASARKGLLAVAIVCAAMLSLEMDVLGLHYLVDRNREMIRGMIAFEHSVPSGYVVGPVLPWAHQLPMIDELDRYAPIALRESMRLGIYRPPVY